MKRYLLFKIERYYPSGGMDDLVEDFDSIEVAKAVFNKSTDKGKYVFWYIYDLQTKEEIELK